MPITIVKEIESSANKLNQDDGSILKGFGGCFYIENRKNRKCPFIVCEKKKGYFTCSAACHRFKTFSTCSHVVAVAHSLGKLEEVIKYMNAKNKKINVSRICDRDKEMLAGRKLSKNVSALYSLLPSLIESYRVLSSHTESYRVVPSRTESYRVVPSRTESYRVVPSRTESYRVVPSRTESYRVVPSLIESYLVVPSLIETYNLYY